MEYKNISVEKIAEVCHNVNKAYCDGTGDLSQPSWDNAPDWQKQSAINGVNYHIATPNAKLSDSHVNWLKEKVDNGWVFGPIKDPEKKVHPFIMPYDELPLSQRLKDALFIAVVKSFI